MENSMQSNTPNPEQQRVIDALDSNIVLFASAGTGKTFTVANRVKTVIERGLAKPEEILCLTFTIKACEEMREDIARYNSNVDGINIKTIHSFCLEVIDEQSKLFGEEYTAPTVFDDVDEEELLSRLVPECIRKFELYDFLKSIGISGGVEGLYKRDISFLDGRIYWNVEQNGESFLLNSRREKVPLQRVYDRVNNTTKSVCRCPNCNKRLERVENICPDCQYDLRTYVEPYKFSVRQYYGLISAIKRHRAVLALYSDDEVSDYNVAFEELKKLDERKLRSSIYGTQRAVEWFFEKFAPYAGKVVHAYNNILKLSNRVDFDDLIVKSLHLLKQKEVVSFWSKKFKYIIVDEMQDTSVLEYDILRRVFGKNIVMMCGDIFQTIYEWRGSEPFKILNDFIKMFNAKTYMFAKNYRSTKTLTNATFGFLASTNKSLLGKFCPSEIEVNSPVEGEKIECHMLYDEADEAEFIYKYLLSHPSKEPMDVCIMSRSNKYISRLYKNLNKYSLTQPLEKRLSFFTVDEDYRFYKKPVVKDILAFWAVLINRCDTLSLERIAENYIRGVGAGTLANIREYGGIGLSLSAFLEEDSYSHGDNFYTLIKECNGANVVVYDIETTGLDVAVDEIIQIAGVKMDADGNILSKFNQMVVPSREISDGALATHGFDKKYILEHGGVSARCALINFSEFVRGSVIAGHNNLAFDRAIVDRQLAEENLPPLDVLGEYDTLVLSKLLYPSSINYKLETMCKLFGVSNLRAHDAFFDVTATAKVLSCLVKRNIIPSTDVRKKALKKFANRFAPFYKHYKNMSDLLNENKIYELNDYITKNFDIFSRHSEDEDRTACTEIMQIFGCYCAKGDSVKVCIKNFLCDTALSGSQMDILIKRLKKIPIITVHQAKGCEFKTVIIAGADNNNFPSYSAVQSGNGAEEVRVFYVAISRAKQKLILTCYKNARSSYGNTYEKFFSPYIKHIPQQYVKYFL